MSSILRFLFWNTNNKASNLELITHYGAAEKIDVIALCETGLISSSSMNGYSLVEHIVPNTDVNVFIRDGLEVFYTTEKRRYCLLRVGFEYDLNIAVAHLNSDLYPEGKEHRRNDLKEIKSDLETIEAKWNNKNSLLIGDLNENPYSDIMTEWGGLNCVYYKYAVKAKGRMLHDNKRSDYFYNPMLHLIQDNDDADIAKGTYFYKGNWYYYDQLLLKYPLAKQFDFGKLSLISKLGNTHLVANHRIIDGISDHIPLYFEVAKSEE